MEGAVLPTLANTRVSVVTGGNKGIGFEVCRQLASGGITVVLTARDETRGGDAVERLNALGLSQVVFHRLEITEASSAAALAGFLKTRFGKLDILVNNAAVGGVEYGQELDANEEKNAREPIDSAKNSVQTNYYGTKRVTEALLPLLRSSPDGRIVNVSSNYGLLRHIGSEEVRQELNDVDDLTEGRLDELLEKFVEDFESGALEPHGWPAKFSAYKVAKAAMNAYSRILARRHPELRVNCAHPGFVKTDMSMGSGVLTPEEGARSLVKVALLPDGGPTGAYFAQGEEAPFV
ncbi:hypothetical protein ZWY2020_055394 [Hordeum vulgare]|nr:hypothetical protein ZWY2020_055394 [Hordeum vulgare]